MKLPSQVTAWSEYVVPIELHAIVPKLLGDTKLQEGDPDTSVSILTTKLSEGDHTCFNAIFMSVSYHPLDITLNACLVLDESSPIAISVSALLYIDIISLYT